MARLAIFDFDGTIYRGDTLRLFLRVLGQRGRRWAVRRFYLTQWPAYLVYRLGLWRKHLMTHAMRGVARLLAGLSEPELEAYFHQCLAAARPRFNQASLARLRSHLDDGDRVILLSGAFTLFLAMVARELGARDVLGTELVMRDGRCRGMGRHGIGPAKAEMLRAFLAEQEAAGDSFDLSASHAYADSAHDLPLLSLVGHPVAVEPDKGLRREAVRRGWEVI